MFIVLKTHPSTTTGPYIMEGGADVPLWRRRMGDSAVQLVAMAIRWTEMRKIKKKTGATAEVGVASAGQSGCELVELLGPWRDTRDACPNLCAETQLKMQLKNKQTENHSNSSQNENDAGWSAFTRQDCVVREMKSAGVRDSCAESLSTNLACTVFKPWDKLLVYCCFFFHSM